MSRLAALTRMAFDPRTTAPEATAAFERLRTMVKADGVDQIVDALVLALEGDPAMQKKADAGQSESSTGERTGQRAGSGSQHGPRNGDQREKTDGFSSQSERQSDDRQSSGTSSQDELDKTAKKQDHTRAKESSLKHKPSSPVHHTPGLSERFLNYGWVIVIVIMIISATLTIT